MRSNNDNVSTFDQQGWMAEKSIVLDHSIEASNFNSVISLKSLTNAKFKRMRINIFI